MTYIGSQGIYYKILQSSESNIWDLMRLAFVFCEEVILISMKYSIKDYLEYSLKHHVISEVNSKVNIAKAKTYS